MPDAKAITRVDADGWRRAVADAPAPPPGAAPDFLEAVLGSMPGASGGAVLVEGGDGVLGLPVVVQAGIATAMPFGIPGGPVVLSGRPGPFRPQAVRRALEVEQLIAVIHHSSAAGYRARAAEIYSTHVLRLEGEDPRSLYRQRTRRKLRSAEASAVAVRTGSPADAGKLIEILAVAAEHDQRPLYPDATVIGAIAGSEQTVTLFATHDGEDVSAGLFFHSPRELLYWKGGTLPASAELSPSYAVIDAAARLALERGCVALDLGSSGGIPGLVQFKQGFGAEQVEYPSIVASSLRHRLHRLRR